MTDLNKRVEAYSDAVATTFKSKVQDALQKIGEPPLQLLALRRYIRKARDLDSQWVWSHEQIATYEHSPEFVQVRHEIQKVVRKFEELNPGYTLGVSPIRDLNRQVVLWKRNKTVHAAAADLKRKCLLEVVDYPDLPNLSARERFRTFLRHCEVHPEPTSAAPGLSDHGQMHAIDFVVMQGSIKIADTTSQTIGIKWDQPGWTNKLKDAVTQSNSLFVGPLQHPREPWHYTLPH